MSAVFLRSLPLAIVTSNALDRAPARRVLSPEPALVMRASGNTAIITFDVGSTKAYDTIAVMANIGSAGVVRSRGGSDKSMTTAIDFDQSASWSGIAPDERHALIYLTLPASETSRYVRLDIQDTGLAEIEVSHVLIGQRIECDGIDGEPEFTPRSGTDIEDGSGWTTASENRTRLGWKFSVGNVKRTPFFTQWSPFINGVNIAKPFMFIPDTETDVRQRQAGIYRNVDMPKTSELYDDRWKMEFTVLEV